MRNAFMRLGSEKHTLVLFVAVFTLFVLATINLGRGVVRSFLFSLFCIAALIGSIPFAVHAQNPASKIYHPPPHLPVTSFYDTSEPLPVGKPGTLIRSEAFDGYRLSYEVSAVRILYHSVSAQGKDIAASGVVLLPEVEAPAGGWPIIAWAHEFTGSARQCAPSLMSTVNEGPLLSMYASLGYAVVASDYAGLGTNFPYTDLDIKSHALDVIYSVSAARAALPQLGSKWLVAGYSEGAMVAAAVAESEESKSNDYLGAIGVSGVAEPGEMFNPAAAQGMRGSQFVFLARGIKAVFPEFRAEEILTDKGMQLYREIGQSCEAKADQRAGDLLKPDWELNRYVKLFFFRNTLYGKAMHGPFLVISGEADQNMPSELTAKVVSRLCEQKVRTLFVKYPGLSGSAALSNSVSEQASWIKARFAGLAAPSNCP